jgi:hypothetical protein
MQRTFTSRTRSDQGIVRPQAGTPSKNLRSGRAPLSRLLSGDFAERRGRGAKRASSVARRCHCHELAPISKPSGPIEPVAESCRRRLFWRLVCRCRRVQVRGVLVGRRPRPGYCASFRDKGLRSTKLSYRAVSTTSISRTWRTESPLFNPEAVATGPQAGSRRRVLPARQLLARRKPRGRDC